MAALPPEPLPEPDRKPDSPPVYAPGDEIAPAAEVPGVSIEPMPGAQIAAERAGGLLVFVPSMQPVEEREPDLGDENLPSAAVEAPAQSPPVDQSPPPRPVSRPPRPRVVPASATVIEVPLPIVVSDPPPPVHQRWQTILARLRTDTDWRSLAFRGQ